MSRAPGSFGYNKIALFSGAFFVVMGVLFLLEQLDVISLRAAYVVPVVVIVIGIAILLGARPSARRGGSPAP
jgi:hypothetical protein